MAAAAATVAGAGLGAAQFFEGRKEARAARKAIDAFQPQELTNPYEDLQVSTLGAELQAEEAARFGASGVQALQQGGSRALIGGLGRLQSGINRQTQQIAAGLDQQQKQIDFARAGQDVQNQAIREQREQAQLAGLGQQLSVAQQNKYQGAGTFIQGLQALGSQGIQAPQLGGNGGQQPQQNFNFNPEPIDPYNNPFNPIV